MHADVYYFYFVVIVSNFCIDTYCLVIIDIRPLTHLNKKGTCDTLEGVGLI